MSQQERNELVYPLCGQLSRAKVTDSRQSSRRNMIRRRRHCSKCEGRYTTYETIADLRQKGELTDLLPLIKELVDAATELRLRTSWRWNEPDEPMKVKAAS